MREKKKRTSGKLFTVVMPEHLHDQLRRAAKLSDLDNSKFVRHAVREKIDRLQLAA